MRYVLPAFLLCACVAYRPAPVDLAETAREFDSFAAEGLDFAAAVGFANAHNPELLRLRSEARAAGLDIPPAMIGAGADQHRKEVMARFDPLEVARTGQRGAAANSAYARQVAVLAELREAERRNAAEMAECYLVERILREQELPPPPPEPGTFVAAGLASDAAAAQARFARESHAAQELEIRAERGANLARLRRLLGVGANAPLTLALPAGDFPALPEPDRERLLAHPELAAALARYQTADAEFREAVWRQYPTIEIGPAFEWSGSKWGGLVELRVPLGASRQARAAEERREAARCAVEAGLLRAEEAAAAREAEHHAAAARARAGAAEADAALRGYAAASARLEIEADAFAEAARQASMAVSATTAARESALAEARARVAFAGAYGWPRPEELR